MPATLDSRPVHGSKANRRLVIADDSAEMRWLVRSAIGEDFGEVVEAADGRELFWALLRSSDDREQVIVTDIWMPTYDGLEVLDAWGEHNPRAPTVIITAFPSDVVRRRAAELGAVVLAKPFSTATLRRVIREATHERRDR